MRNSTNTYKIRQVIDLTGASEFILRVWENRYSAFKPTRTKTGRRLYSENDVLKARALFQLTKQGVRVGDIAHKSLSELNQLLNSDAENKLEKILDPSIKNIMQKISQFSWDDVRALILFEKKRRQPLSWIKSLIVPLLSEMSRQVDTGKFSIAQEHILSAILKQNLAHINTKAAKKNTPRIVLATPEGDFHDLGILIASYIASELRTNYLLLGPHVPKKELASVCLKYKATHLVLSSTADKHDGAKDEYLEYLNYLDRNINTKITFWLAGRNPHKYPTFLKRPFKVIESFDSFEAEIKKCLI